MSECYGGVNIVGMVKETIEVFFWLGSLHVNVVCETKPTKHTKQSDKELNTLMNDKIFVPPISFSNFPMKMLA
jgi:hypothetical protein